MTDKPTHGGARKGSGRKPTKHPLDVLIAARVTPEQRDKFRALGGSEWLRKLIDKARA